MLRKKPLKRDRLLTLSNGIDVCREFSLIILMFSQTLTVTKTEEKLMPLNIMQATGNSLMIFNADDFSDDNIPR